MTARRTLIRERSKLQLHPAADVSRSRFQRGGILEIQYGGVRGGIRLKLQPALSGRSLADHGGNVSLQFRLQLFRHPPAARRLQIRHPLLALPAAPGFVHGSLGNPQGRGRDRQINILGKPADDAEHLRQCGAALEHQRITPFRMNE